jgi:hypothetical protein
MAEFLQDNLRVFVAPVALMEFPDLDIYEQMIYMVLRSFCNPRNNSVFPKYATLAKNGRMSERKAIDAVKGLIEKRLIKKEIRLKVTSNRKVTNDSNLYTLIHPNEALSHLGSQDAQDGQDAPGGVHDMHPGGAQDAPGGVHDMHPPGAQRAYEQNHLTKQNRIKSFKNNNNKETTPNKQATAKQQIVAKQQTIAKKYIEQKKANDVVVDLLSQKGIKPTTTTINKWLKLANEETVISAIHEVLKRPDIKNVIGYITRMLEQGYTSPQATASKTKTAKVKKDHLPEWIIKQSELANQKVSVTQEELTEEQKKQALELLKQLGEIATD